MIPPAVAAIVRRVVLERRGGIGPGAVVVLPKSKDRYVLTHVAGGHVTVRREVPKVKGKAARKAERVARRGQGLV